MSESTEPYATLIGWSLAVLDEPCECGGDLLYVLYGVSTATTVDGIYPGGMCMLCGAEFISDGTLNPIDKSEDE